MSPVATRITVGAGLIAGTGAILLLDVPLSEWAGRPLLPGFWFVVLVALLSGGREFFRMLRRSGRPCHPVLGLLFIVLFPALAGTEARPCCVHEWFRERGIEPYLLLVVAMIFATFAAEILRAERAGSSMAQGLAGISWTMLVVLTVGVLGVFIVKIRNLGTSSLEGLLYLVLVLGVAKVCDIGAYAIGASLGKHKLAPTLSPKKTVEGLFGGLAGGTAAALAIGLAWGRFTWPEMLLFGAVVSTSSILGDLAESLMKRACEVKDSGSIPGFGGALDILDSILAAGPVAYLMLVLLTGPSRAG
jgi:phosphatidate cytidylyltransferase